MGRPQFGPQAPSGAASSRRARKSASALQRHPIGLDKAQPPSRDRTGPVEGSIGHAADAISRRLVTLKDIKAKKRNLKSKLNF